MKEKEESVQVFCRQYLQCLDPQQAAACAGCRDGYSLLELKAGLQETEFKLSFGRFIRCVCRLLGIPIKDDTIVQTWTRTSVRNDLELSQIAQQSIGVISDETIVEHHPWVEDAAKELERLQKQEEKAQEQMADYQDAFQKRGKNGEGGDPVNGEEE